MLYYLQVLNVTEGAVVNKADFSLGALVKAKEYVNQYIILQP